MSEQLSIKNGNLKKRPVFIGGIPQNFYLRAQTVDNSIIPEHLKNHTQLKYDSLERVQLLNGFTEEVVEKDYPINSETVSSYIESADYRNDPSQAVANAPKRVNLGDISEAQAFVRENPVQASKYADILQKVADYFKKQGQVQVVQKKASEVNNDVKSV